MERNNLFSENFRQNSHWITGEVQDVLIDREGRRTYLPESHNLVVDGCSTLIAAFMKGSGTAGALKYWAIGGISSDDNSGLITDATFSNPVSSDSKLVNEIYRQEIINDNTSANASNINFVNSDNTISQTPTNKLKITIVIPYSVANGTWYEFGIFGGASATEDANTGIMINRKVHDPIIKSANLQVERNIIFTF